VDWAIQLTNEIYSIASMDDATDVSLRSHLNITYNRSEQAVIVPPTVK
jgi:hypothetical protein